MKRSQRLNAVVELAHRKAQDGARALAYIQQKLQADEQQLEQLHQYLHEYRTSLYNQAIKGISAQQFRIHNNFSENVDRAIAQQSNQVATVTRQVEQVRQHWQVLDAKYKGLLKLKDRLVQEERAVQDKQEQKEQDEYAGRMHGRARR